LAIRCSRSAGNTAYSRAERIGNGFAERGEIGHRPQAARLGGLAVVRLGDPHRAAHVADGYFPSGKLKPDGNGWQLVAGRRHLGRIVPGVAGLLPSIVDRWCG
jgi:catechol 2,3-dioxygenase-like lactoylglutathione lyase family enzyme